LKITFIDAGVLIAASRGSTDMARRALEILDDPGRSFASSAFAQERGLSALDALHGAAALAVNAAELVTTEKRSRPIHRLTQLKVTTIDSN
jgi:predicted nucleic acid-binding protein